MVKAIFSWLLKLMDILRTVWSRVTTWGRPDLREPEKPTQTPAPVIHICQLKGLEDADTHGSDAMERLLSIRKKLRLEGRAKALKTLLERLSAEERDDMEKAQEVLEACESLEKYKREIVIEPVTDPSSPVIYPEAIEQYTRELGLKVTTQPEFENAMKEVLQHIYRLGVFEVTKRIEVERRYLRKALEENDPVKINRLLTEIKEELQRLEHLGGNE